MAVAGGGDAGCYSFPPTASATALPRSYQALAELSRHPLPQNAFAFTELGGCAEPCSSGGQASRVACIPPCQNLPTHQPRFRCKPRAHTAKGVLPPAPLTPPSTCSPVAFGPSAYWGEGGVTGEALPSRGIHFRLSTRKQLRCLRVHNKTYCLTMLWTLVKIGG